MQIQISWLLQKPTDLDLHCLQRQGISGFSRTRVKPHADSNGPDQSNIHATCSKPSLNIHYSSLYGNVLFFCLFVLDCFVFFYFFSQPNNTNPCMLNKSRCHAHFNFQPIRLLDPGCWYKFTYLTTNSADPDQLSSSRHNGVQQYQG